MFGMLDYRAHKLYKVLVFPAILVLIPFALFCLPIIAYLLAAHFSSERLFQLIAAVVILFLLGIPWIFVVKIIVAIPQAIFNFLIDPEPDGGRTKEEAKLVVQSGEKGITLLTFNKPASEWSDDAIEALSKITLTSRIFQNKIRMRTYALRNYYLEHPEVTPNEYATKKFLKENNLRMGWLEALITNPMWRNAALQLLTLLAIFIITAP